MSKDNEKEIMEKLKKLPKIADESDKEELFLMIASRLNSEATPKPKKKPNRLLPLLTTAAVLIFVIALPFLLTNMNSQTLNDGMKMNTVNEGESSIMESEDSAEITSFSLDEDKKTEIAFDIQKTIPAETNFEIEIDNEVLIFTLLSDERQNEAVLTKTFIESSLMTAKRYGFQYVYFKNMPFTELDEYDLSKPIEVPLGTPPNSHPVDPE